jgi:hypothetical protein
VVVVGAVVVVEAVTGGNRDPHPTWVVVVVGRVVVEGMVAMVTGGVGWGPLGKTALIVDRLFKP